MVNWQKHTRWCWWLTYEPTLFRTSIIHSKTIWLFFIIKQEIHEREEVKNNIDTPSMSSSYIEEPRPDSVTKPSKHHIAFISSSPLKSFKTATMHVSRELWQHGKSLYIFLVRERDRGNCYFHCPLLEGILSRYIWTLFQNQANGSSGFSLFLSNSTSFRFKESAIVIIIWKLQKRHSFKSFIISLNENILCVLIPSMDKDRQIMLFCMLSKSEKKTNSGTCCYLCFQKIPNKTCMTLLPI